MPVPRANPGGLYGSGVHPTAPHQIDVAGAIKRDRRQRARSLIHGAYLRKMEQWVRAAAPSPRARRRNAPRAARRADRVPHGGARQ